MILQFEKYQGLGNDFVLIHEPDGSFLSEIVKLIPDICHRHFGVGADGLLLYNRISENRVKMRYFNADGTRAEICLNGLRCLALHAGRIGDCAPETTFQVETDAGAVNVKANQELNLIQTEVVGADFSPQAVHLETDAPNIDLPLLFSFGVLKGTALSIGNPHYVVWNEGKEDLRSLNVQVKTIGAAVENSKYFSQGTNLEIVSLVDENTINMAVWERGVGHTLACGSGATASVLTGVKTGRLKPDRPIKVIMEGGELEVTANRDLSKAVISGEAIHVFSGQMDTSKFKGE